MGELRRFDVARLDEIVQLELQDLKLSAEIGLERELERRQVILTSELHDSIRSKIVQECRDLYAEMVIDFRGYGRLQDLRFMDYKAMDDPDNQGMKYKQAGEPRIAPSVARIEQFVRWHGVSKFKFVPGYEGRFRPDDNRAIRRIAYGVLWGRVRQGRALLRGRGWYSKGRSKFVRDFRRKVSARMAVVLAELMVGGIGDS